MGEGTGRHGFRTALAAGTAGLIALGMGSCAPLRATVPSSPSVAGMVTATWADDTHRIALRMGQQVEVTLGGSSCTPISVPATSAPRVLAPERVGNDREGNAWALFRAVGPGTATVTAANGDACAGAASGVPSFTFRLAVTVT